jgi:hypothetical protein
MISREKERYRWVKETICSSSRNESVAQKKVISCIAHIRINNMIEVTQVSSINQTFLISF